MSEDDKRSGHKRESMIKAAKLIYGASVVDCVVQNISATGARVRTSSVVVPVPEEVVLRLPDGQEFRAQRRWTRGMQIGLHFIVK